MTSIRIAGIPSCAVRAPATLRRTSSAAETKLVPALIVIGIVVLVNQLEGNFLQPVVLGKSLNLHSLAVLLALTIGTVLGGIVGTLLAVPVAAVAWTLVKSWYEPMSELERDVREAESKRSKRKPAAAAA